MNKDIKTAFEEYVLEAIRLTKKQQDPNVVIPGAKAMAELILAYLTLCKESKEEKE